MHALIPFALLLALAQDTPARNLPSLPKAEFHERRVRLMEALHDGVLVMEAEKLLPGMDAIDQNTPRYDYTYLAGYHSPGDLLVLVPSEKKAFIFTTGDAARAREASGVDLVLPRDRFAAFSAEVLSAAATIYSRVREEALDTLKKSAPDAAFKSSDARGRNAIHLQLSQQRMVKSAPEIAMMRKAADATNQAHLAAMRACRGGLNEGALQKIIEDTFTSEGCDGLGFPSIVGGGVNGTVLHYMENTKPLPANSLVVCDIGASYRGYVTDITRTLPTDGKYTDAQKAAYQCVLDAQKAAEALLKPGATFAELERAARRVFSTRSMTKWSYAHSDDWTVRHGLGHYVGMAVHDSGAYQAPFESGVIITIEPGWYDKDAGWGIRIEDIYLVTREGFERLSSAAPREIADIEKLMAEARAGK